MVDYVQCRGMCMIMLEADCQPGTSNPHCPPSLALFCRAAKSSCGCEKELKHSPRYRGASAPRRVSLSPAAAPVRSVRTAHRCVARWSLRAERLLLLPLSLVLTAVHARRAVGARSRRIGSLLWGFARWRAVLLLLLTMLENKLIV